MCLAAYSKIAIIPKYIINKFLVYLNILLLNAVYSSLT